MWGMATTPALGRLAAHVKARRHQLGLARLQAAQAAGMSKDTWLRVETGNPVRALNYAKIDNVLEWEPGTCADIAAGARDTPQIREGGAQFIETAVIRSAPLDGVEDEIQQAVVNATIATTPGLTAAEIGKLGERVIEELRRRGVLPPVPDK